MKFHRKENQMWETSIDIALIRFMLYVLIMMYNEYWINKWNGIENVSIRTLFGQVETSVFIADIPITEGETAGNLENNFHSKDGITEE